MNHVVIHVGDLKETYFREAFGEYKKRLSAFGGLEELVLKPAKTAGRDLSAEEIRLALEKEGEAFRSVLHQPKIQKSFKIALCIEGKSMDSPSLARLYEEIAQSGKNTVTYLIGGSWGIHPSVKAEADLRLSFSPMTFAHSLFAVMLSEQIYRAESILRGNGYHK